MIRLIETIEEMNISEFGYDDFYSQKENIYIRFYEDGLSVIELENALKSGKEVMEITLRNEIFDRNDSNFIGDIKSYLSSNQLKFSSFIEGLINKKIDSIEGYKIIVSYTKSIRVFNPFYKPKKILEPKKWTVSHIIKGILTGQIVDGICTKKLSDDYLFDSITNFGKGSINLLELCKDIVESPSGWWVNQEKEFKNGLKLLGVNCHHFNYNQVSFDPNGDRIIETEEINNKENVIFFDKYKQKKEIKL